MNKRKIRVQIIQPLIPQYRVPLFEKLIQNTETFIKICASKSVPGINNLTSIDMEIKNLVLDFPCQSFLNNRFFWQSQLSLDKAMGPNDVLVVNGNLRFLSNYPLILEAKRKKVGLVWWEHGFSNKRYKLENILNRIIVKLVDVRLLYSDNEVDEYKQLGCPVEKLFATNNAIDQEPVKKAISAWTRSQLTTFKEKEKIKDKKILLFCGRRTDGVDLELVFTVLSKLNKNKNKYLFVIIGPDHQIPPLNNKAKELDISTNIRWLGPIYNQHNLAPWFLSSCCLVFPGTIGLSLLHAFSYGLPVILPKRIHGPEIVALCDGENGLFYKDGCADDLRNKIIAIAEQPVVQKTMSNKALQTIREKYNMNDMVTNFLAAIKAASATSQI